MLNHDTSIPLFPLGVVLFPGMMLPLHIFEERYKAMIKECLTSGNPFGVVLVKHGQSPVFNVNDKQFTDFYSVGTTARITAIEQLKNGRLNLLTIGQERFILKDCYPGLDNFLVGRVDPFPLNENVDGDGIEKMTKTLHSMMQRYINHLADASGEDLSNAKLPTDPTSLAFLAGTAIQGPYWANESDKQKLLSTQSLSSLIARTIHILDREDHILVYMLKAYRVHQQVQRLPFVDYSLN